MIIIMMSLHACTVFFHLEAAVILSSAVRFLGFLRAGKRAVFGILDKFYSSNLVLGPDFSSHLLRVFLILPYLGVKFASLFSWSILERQYYRTGPVDDPFWRSQFLSRIEEGPLQELQP